MFGERGVVLRCVRMMLRRKWVVSNQGCFGSAEGIIVCIGMRQQDENKFGGLALPHGMSNQTKRNYVCIAAHCNHVESLRSPKFPNAGSLKFYDDKYENKKHTVSYNTDKYYTLKSA